MPSGFEDLLTRHLKLLFIHLAQHGGGGKLTVGIEHADEALGNQVIYLPLEIRQVGGLHARRDNGMVISHFRGVEHFLGFLQRFASQHLHQLRIGLNAIMLYLKESVHRRRTFRVDIITQELGIYTWVGGEFLLVQTLNGVERLFGTHGEFTVAVHLQGGQIIKMWRCLGTIFLLYGGNGEGFVGNRLKGLLSFFLGGVLSFRCYEGGIPIDGGQHPVRLGHEGINLLLSVHDQSQCGCLHPTDAQHLFVLSVL